LTALEQGAYLLSYGNTADDRRQKMQTALKTENAKAENLSTLAIALEKAHAIIKEETGAPRATILVTRNLKGRKGHFTHFTPWTAGGDSFHEIAFNLEHFTTAEELLSTLIHEVAHSLNFQNGIQDTSRGVRS